MYNLDEEKDAGAKADDNSPGLDDLGDETDEDGEDLDSWELEADLEE